MSKPSGKLRRLTPSFGCTLAVRPKKYLHKTRTWNICRLRFQIGTKMGTTFAAKKRPPGTKIPPDATRTWSIRRVSSAKRGTLSTHVVRGVNQSRTSTYKLSLQKTQMNILYLRITPLTSTFLIFILVLIHTQRTLLLQGLPQVN